MWNHVCHQTVSIGNRGGGGYARDRVAGKAGVWGGDCHDMQNSNISCIACICLGFGSLLSRRQTRNKHMVATDVVS